MAQDHTTRERIMSTRWQIRTIALVGAIWGVATLIACSDDSTGPTTSTMYVAQLSSANEVPAIPGGASGTATFTLTGKSLSYVVSVNGLSGPAAASHIHQGAAGTNGGILYPFTAAPVQSGQVASGTIDLTQPISNGTSSISGDSLLSLLTQGLLYTNVHTAAHVGGEIRGQILSSQGSSGSGNGGSGSGSGY
jgi:CHRD domain